MLKINKTLFKFTVSVRTDIVIVSHLNDIYYKLKCLNFIRVSTGNDFMNDNRLTMHSLDKDSSSSTYRYEHVSTWQHNELLFYKLFAKNHSQQSTLLASNAATGAATGADAVGATLVGLIPSDVIWAINGDFGMSSLLQRT